MPDWQRRRFYEALLASPASEAVLAGQAERASELASRLLSDMQQGLQGRLGEVYLVGAGPGDPDLLTLRALRLMQQADVCLYDNLVSPPILEMVRRDARREYVGKRRNLHAMPQEAINDKLVRLAGEGLRVLRLKGGDPFVFGRGGEEIESLAEHGIPFQVVPGVTAANGCACYAGIPLTHRDYAQSVCFVTGQASAGAPPLPWSELAQPNQTLVVYMGLVRLAEICAQLISHGCPPTMPAALICRGTLPDQQVLVGSLESLPEQVVSAAVQAPTLLIVGEVVLLRTRLG